MTDPWLDKWNNRYSKKEYAFGEAPNLYFKEQLEQLDTGNILLPAEGEGRNAVFAAKRGWNVTAFDISMEGKNKALRLAAENKVTIDYQVGELPALGYQPEQFDVVALIYAHFPARIKSAYHQLLNRYLRKGGVLIFEAFSKKHLEYRIKNEKVGGPTDLASLFSIEELMTDFAGYHIITLTEQEIELAEGLYHRGKGSVIRFTGQKR